MALAAPGPVQPLPGAPPMAESAPNRIGPITLGMKRTGKRSAGKPHAAFDVAGAGNVAMVALCTHPTSESVGLETLRLRQARQFSTLPTGRPKGSLIPSRGIVRLVYETNYMTITPDDVFSQAASVSFDAATFEILGRPAERCPSRPRRH